MSLNWILRSCCSSLKNLNSSQMSRLSRNQIIQVKRYYAAVNKTAEELRRKELMAKNLPKRKVIEGVKKVVLVASGKGGVGKSTIATNLAVGLKAQYPSKDIGLLDADVFGPSLPIMMNLLDAFEPDLNADGLMIPYENYGVKCMSMGFLVKSSNPVIWRGLMVMQAIEKLVRGVKWSPLDILIVDMPPGTGDTQLSFAQSVIIDGAVIISTPQKVALQDAIKGSEMFKKTNVPVLGFILNMSSFICDSCGHHTRIGNEQIANLIKSYKDTELIGDIPYQVGISQSSDEGVPFVISNEKSPQAQEMRNISKKIYDKLSLD